MSKAFLSHSSKQKIFVEEVANQLGARIIIDSKSFEEGMETMDEIIRTLEVSDIFVLFLSKEALESEWVKTEIDLAKERSDNNDIKRIYPIIIDANLKHNDPAIPAWLKDRYVLRQVLRTGKAVRLIKQRLREIAWHDHPKLRQRDLLFVGRNNQLKDFEERMDDINKSHPFTIIASGLRKIGRKTFLKNALLKSNIIYKDSYDPPIITISSRESIEDFIIKIYDLGFSEDKVFPNFMETDLGDKVTIAIDLLRSCQKSNEIILIEDNGGIVLPDRTLAGWFMDILNNYREQGLADVITICVAARFRIIPHFIVKKENIYHTQISELSKTENTGLLKRCLGIFDISITREEIAFFADNIHGFPEQSHYCVQLIKEDGVRGATKNIHLIRDYQKEIFSSLISKIESDTNVKNILAILAEFDFISFELLYDTLDDLAPELMDDTINKLVGHSVVEFLGVNKEYIRLNDGIRDFLLRAGYALSPKYKAKLKSHIESFLKTDALIDADVSDFFFSLKGALEANYRFQSKLLLPSHYLKTMISLYERGRNYKDVVILADRVLERKQKIDLSIQREIRYRLCLALARLKDDRFKEEAQFFEGSDYYFLLGFFYRMIGKLDYALSNYTTAIGQRPRFPKAQRELVQVLMSLEQYEDAYDHSHHNYKNDRDNPYHIQAYFDCIIRNNPSIADEQKLLALINELTRINTKKSLQMANMAEADYALYVKQDYSKALKLIDQGLDREMSPYPLMKKFNIFEKSGNIEEMQKVIKTYESKYRLRNTNEYYVLVTMKAKFEAHKGDKTQAIHFINTELKYYPQKAQERLVEYIYQIKPSYSDL